MKFIKKNIKLIIEIIVGMVLISGVSVYAAYNYLASEVSYTKADGTKLNVQEALTELYMSDNEKYPSINEIYYNVSPSVNYTYTINETGKYLVGIMEAHRNYTPTISTTGKENFSKIMSGSSGRKSLISYIDGKSGDTISLVGANDTQDYSTNLTAFIYKINNFNISEVANSSISDDATTTLSYTSSQDNEKVLFLAIGNSRNVSDTKLIINYQDNKFRGALFHNSCVYVDCAVLNKNQKVTASAYGYNWGGGAVYILK